MISFALVYKNIIEESFILTHVLIKYCKRFFYLISAMETIIDTKTVVNFQKGCTGFESMIITNNKVLINKNESQKNDYPYKNH